MYPISWEIIINNKQNTAIQTCTFHLKIFPFQRFKLHFNKKHKLSMLACKLQGKSLKPNVCILQIPKCFTEICRMKNHHNFIIIVVFEVIIKLDNVEKINMYQKVPTMTTLCLAFHTRCTSKLLHRHYPSSSQLLVDVPCSIVK